MRPSADRTKRLLQAVASIAVTVGLLGWLFGRLDLDRLRAELAGMQLGWLGLAAALGPVQVALAAERWRRVSGRLGAPIPRGRAVGEMALGTFLNQVVPGGVAGDAVRAWRTRLDGPAGSLGGAVRAVVADRLVGLGVNVAVALAGLALWTQVHGVGPLPTGAAAVTGAVGVALVGLVLLPAAVPGVGRIAADLRVALADPRAAAQLVAISVVMTASFLLGFVWCGRAVGVSVGVAALTAMPLVLLSMSVPIGFAGWGLREVTAAAVLPRLGVPVESAVALSACYGLSVLIGALPGAVVPLVALPAGTAAEGEG